jgi:hypothetical protein
MISDGCEIPTETNFKIVIHFHNRNCSLIVGSMATVDLFVGDNRQSAWIAELKLVQSLTQPSDPTMTLCC